MLKPSRLAGLTLLASGALILIGCTQPSPSPNGSGNSSTISSVSEQTLVEEYIRTHISDLSPTKAVMGGTFFVSKITFRTGNRAVVEYEDGHIAEVAVATYEIRNGRVEIKEFRVLPQ